MLTDEELSQLLKSGEADLVERKSTIEHNLDRIRQAICAFANDLPDHRRVGVIFVGVNDDGTCANLSITDELLKRLAGLRDEGKILPFPSLIVQKRTVAGCELAVVMVEPSIDPPVSVDGRVWIRIGPRRAKATRDEERRLLEKRRWGELPPDAQPVSGATLEELDQRRFQIEYLPAAVSPEMLTENQRSVSEQLMSHRFIFQNKIPTRTGLLVSGIEPRRWMPGAYIQFRRIAGLQLIDETIDQHECGGTVLDQIRRIEELLDVHIREALILGDHQHEIRETYPLRALQQLVRNAILHRTYEGSNAPVRITWYSDRIEVQSPGGPYGQVTAENFGRPGITDYRNPTLAAAMKDLGLVEKFGLGMEIIRHSLEKNRNPPAEFSIDPNSVLVTIRQRS